MNRRTVTIYAPLVVGVGCGLIAILLAFAIGSATGRGVTLADTGFALVMLGLDTFAAVWFLGLYVLFAKIGQPGGSQPPGTTG